MVAFNARVEPYLSVPTVTAVEPLLDDPKPQIPVVAPEFRTNLRAIAPSDFAILAYELYMVGELTWNQFRLTGFPSEMHPRFNETIGALTGEYAQPDQPKDMLAAWEDRVDFLVRYQPGADRTQDAEKVLDILFRYHID